MKLYGFNGTQTAFEIRLDDDIEVTYCDFTLRPDYIKIHSIDFVHEVDRCLVNLEILAKTMHEYVDWSEMEQDAFDEDDLIFKNNKSMYTSKSFDENIESKRLIDYSKSRYSEEEDVKIESSLITTSNFAFQGMIQIFSESQIELDGEIQAALNDFTRISRKTSPTKNRFKA